MAIMVRPAQPADHTALLTHALLLNRHEHLITGDRDTTEAGAKATLDSALARIAANAGVALVAEEDGAILGHLFLIVDRAEPYVVAELRDYANVIDAFVREEARRRGVFTALLAEAERIVASRGIRRLMIGVLSGNTAAERTYEAAGFRPYALEMIKTIGP